MAPTKLQELADQVLSLSVPKKLRLAAALVERNQADLAESIAERAVAELHMARILGAYSK